MGKAQASSTVFVKALLDGGLNKSLHVLYQKMEPIWSHIPPQRAEIKILALDFMFKLLLDKCDQREECKTTFAPAKVCMGWS